MAATGVLQPSVEPVVPRTLAGPKGSGEGGPALQRHVRFTAATLLICTVFQVGYLVVFLNQSAFSLGQSRVHPLFDDAMISMQYARNLVQGQGLVWNPGERIEGYSNFAWTMAMAGVHLLPLSADGLCIAAAGLGLLTCIATLLATLALAHACRLGPAASAVALVLVGTYYPVLLLSIWGMEVGLAAAALTGIIACGIGLSGKARLAAMLPLMSLSLLIRDDLVVPLVALLALLWLLDARSRRTALMCLAMLAVTAAAHALFRRMYYDEWLPNTYYLKLTGWPLAHRMLRGTEYTVGTGLSLGLPLALGLAGVLSSQPSRRWAAWLLCVPTIAALAYQVYIGGDAWPLDRMVAATAPALLLSAAWSMDGLLSGPRGRRWLALAAVSLVLIVNARFLSRYSFLQPPVTAKANWANLRYTAAIQRHTSPDALIAVGYAGVVPYYSGRKCCDFLGKIDKVIARQAAQPGVHRPGHNKFDYEYTVSAYRPDLVIHGMPRNAPTFNRDYLPMVTEVEGRPVVLFVREDSDKVQGLTPITWLKAHSLLSETHRASQD